MKRDYDIWRWMLWGTLTLGIYQLWRIANALNHLAAALY